jgi:arsenite-transporting ATPase
VVNRIIPEEVEDPYFGKWKDIQRDHLQTVRESFEPVPILEARLFDREMVGLELLAAMGEEVYGDRDATAILHRDEPLRVVRRGSSHVLSLRLPFTEKAEIEVYRKADELFVRVGSYKRNLVLPHTLQRLEVKEASFVEDRLEIRFAREAGTPARTGTR